MPLETDVPQHLQEARDAEAAFDWRRAVDAYEAALSQISTTPGEDEAAILTALGRCYWNLSEARTAWRTLRRAIALYQERGDGPGQARATLEITRIWGPPDRHRAMIDDAIEALGDTDPPLRARLLLRYRWDDGDSTERWDEALAIAAQYGLEDVLAFRSQNEGWRAFDEGRLEEFVEKQLSSHDVYARLGEYDTATAILRNIGFQLIQVGQLDRGYAFVERCFDEASRVRLLFTAQLALLDMVAVRYARGEFEQCEALLARSPGETDFRADLYRMWIAEARGDGEGALRHMVAPERGGNSPGATAQVHAAAAGALYRAGRLDAAEQALQAFLAVIQDGHEIEDYCHDGPAMIECVLAPADEATLRNFHEAFVAQEQRSPLPFVFSTLQGRSVLPLRAGVAAALGLREEAERIYREGIEWCERERCAADAEICRSGLAALSR